MALALVVLGQSAMASETTVLRCSSVGDALSLLEVKSSGTVAVTVGSGDATPATNYVVQSGLADVSSGTSATLVAQKPGGSSFGGALDKSILLRVIDGQKSAYLAMDGVVYRLRCF